MTETVGPITPQPATRRPAALPSTFRVGVMTAPGVVRLDEFPLPEPGPGELLVRLDAAAICTWEQRTFTGQQRNRFPFVGGHENAGTVVAFGPAYRGTLALGDRVTLAGSSCGSCPWCWSGRDRACPRHYDGVVSYGDAWGPGGFAEYKLHPGDAAFPVGEAPVEVAALAEPLSCALHAARLLDPAPAADVVVVGAGVMGLLNVVALKSRGVRVIVTEADPARLDLAKVLGADELVDARGGDPVDAVRALTEGRGADGVVAATGSAAANEQGMAMLAPRGTLVLFASAHPETPLTLDPNALHNCEQTVRGVVSSEKVDVATAARMIRYGLVELRPLIQSSYPLAELAAALEHAVRPGTYRILVIP